MRGERTSPCGPTWRRSAARLARRALGYRGPPGGFRARGERPGAGTVLLAGTVVTTPLRIGAHVVAMPHVLITHDDEIADGVTFAGRASLGGAVTVGECAYLGQGSSVREMLSIGARAVVGMGSVVLQDVPAGEVWAGVPARRIRNRQNL